MLESRRGHRVSSLRSERSCVMAGRGMVCASVPRAAAAGVEMLRLGGNAVDAALATAAVLCVTEPMQTGLGGDAFALLWWADPGRLVGLNGSGPAPAAASLDAYRARGLGAVPAQGILSTTVPGAVRAWETLAERFGSLPLARVLAPAIRCAEEGFAVTELVAHYWELTLRLGALRNEAARSVWAPGDRAPRAGEWFRCPALADTLRAIARDGADAFYRGAVARAIVATSREEGGFLEPEDLAHHESSWVEPISTSYRGVEVFELPPNGQGLTALQALNVLECFEPLTPTSELAWHRRIEAVKLAFADRDAYVADPERSVVPVKQLLDKGYARRRAALLGERALPGARPGLGGDTVYLCAADERGNLVSWIQSLFGPWGSGLACGRTGVVLQSRGSGFRLEPGHPNALEGGKRPLHTIIPAMLLRDGHPWMAFGVMGGDVQPQAHLAFVSNVVDHGLNPQEALDLPRFRFLGGERVALEEPDVAVDEGGALGEALQRRGHAVEPGGDAMADRFGGGQAIAREGEVWVGASDRRKDGCALGLWD